MNRTVIIDTEEGVAHTTSSNIRSVHMDDSIIKVHSIDKVELQGDEMQFKKIKGCNIIEHVVNITFKDIDLSNKTKTAILYSKKRPVTYNKFKLWDKVMLKEEITVKSFKYHKGTVLKVDDISNVTEKYTYDLVGSRGISLHNIAEDKLELYSSVT